MTTVLRDRIRDATGMGALAAGDRLPGMRALAADMQVDPRLIAAALRQLQQEGLIEVRPRSGAYVAATQAASSTAPALSREWTVEIVSQAVERGVAADRVSAALESLTATDKLRAAVIATTSDQAVGIVRELQENYGIPSAAIFPEQLAGGRLPPALKRAQLMVTTGDLKAPMTSLSAALHKPLIIVRVRPDLLSDEWISFMKGRVYVIVADPRFRAVLRDALKPVPGSGNVTIVLAHGLDLASIPADARTYVTESARRMLGREGLPRRLIRPQRILSSETVRQIVTFLVAHNAAKQMRH
ncbi:MAG: GntR family transcriptional regulator [Gemmatimonadaceae bacterium]